MEGYVTSVVDREAGGFRGAAFRNRSTPSGSERHLLQLTTDEVFADPAAAVSALDGILPGYPRVTAEHHDIADGLVPPAGHLIEVAKVKATGETFVSVRAPGVREWAESGLVAEQVAMLLRLGIVEPEGSSGADPELECRYDTYVVVR